MSLRPHRLTLLRVAAIAMGSAALAGEIAWLHMRWMLATYGQLCGHGSIGHCLACPVALGLLALGLAALLGAARTPLRQVRISVR